MTAVNHVATGALIAVTIKVAVIAIPLSVLFHFICDIIPHFGIYEYDRVKRNSHWLFKLVSVLSAVGTITLLILVPLHTAPVVSWATVLLCMLAAILPDVSWLPMFIREVKTKVEKPMGKFNQIHQAIQWYEKPLGLVVEAFWSLSTISILFLAVK